MLNFMFSECIMHKPGPSNRLGLVVLRKALYLNRPYRDIDDRIPLHVYAHGKPAAARLFAVREVNSDGRSVVA